MAQVKKYRLLEKITDQNELDFMSIDVGRHLESILIIDDSYHIYRLVYDKGIAYVHIKDGKKTKICVYEEEKE